MASTINATTSGVVTTGDSVATLSLQTGGTTAVAIDSAQIVTLSKSLALLGSTSGSVALAAPATAGTQSYTLPTAQPTADGLALTSTKVGAMSWAAPTATAAGSDTQVQYNNGGTAFGAASTFTFNNSTGVVSATGFSGALNGTVGATTPTTGVFTTAKAIAASTQDAVQLQGRAGGTGSFAATITPTTLTASRTVTLPNADINFTTGLPVANGGTGLTAGTSGGIPYYSGASAITSSGALTQYGVVYGGGAGAAPVATAAGTTGQFLGANTSGAPTWQTPTAGAAGSNTQVQFNDGGTALGGDAGLTYNKTTDDLTILGNLVIGTSGKGIDFSATPGTGTSELFADYEEGTWTPTDASGAGLTFSTATGTYTKIGRMVQFTINIVYPTTADTNPAKIGSFPFSFANANSARANSVASYSTYSVAIGLLNDGSGQTTSRFYTATGGASVTNANLSTATIYLSGTYVT